MKETAIIALILISLMTLSLVFIQPIKAQYQGDITINADGSISPSTAPIQQDSNMYLLTGDLIGSIFVMKSNFTFDGNGHTIEGKAEDPTDLNPLPSNSGGIYLQSVRNVTVKGFSIKYCLVGVSLNQSSQVTVSGNNITGIWGFTYFTLRELTPSGIFLWRSSNNIVTGNRLEKNMYGLSLAEHSEHNVIVENTISGSMNKGVSFTLSSSNTFYHNNFDNEVNAYESYGKVSLPNAWDNGKEGNFWNDYSGPDANSDGIGGSPRIINSNNQDRYPLMTPWEPDVAPPRISISWPENVTYNHSNVTLAFSTSESTSKISFSLDGQENVTITGNTTLTELSNGNHNVTVYATDERGNTGTSETIYFSVDAPEPFPTAPIAAASVASVAVTGVGLLVYFKKRKR